MNTKNEYWRAQVSSAKEKSPEDLLLELTLPDDFGGPIECQVRCTSDEEHALMLRMQSEGNISIRGTRTDVTGCLSAELEIDGAWVSQASRPQHGTEHTERLATIRCGNTLIRTILPHNDESEPYSWVYVVDNPWLATAPMPTPHDDGSLEIGELYEDLQASFTLRTEEAPVEFRRVYDWTHQGHSLVRSERLAACVKHLDLGASAELRAAVIEKLDDFLLLAGIATGSFSQCLGFASIGRKDAVTGYRRDRELPRSKEARHYSRDTVVNPGELNLYWSDAYNTFCASAYKREIRTCLHTLRAAKDAWLQPAFLMGFAALELLLSRYREQRGLTAVTDPDTFKKLRETFASQLKQFDALEKWQRRALRANLRQLNRAPLNEVVSSFVTEFEIDLEAIWPISGQGGLTAVRNLLVHGATVTDDKRFHSALSIANAHLYWTLEVVLLALLGWPREKTQRRPHALSVLFPGDSNLECVASAQSDIAVLTTSALN